MIASAFNNVEQALDESGGDEIEFPLLETRETHDFVEHPSSLLAEFTHYSSFSDVGVFISDFYEKGDQGRGCWL